MAQSVDRSRPLARLVDSDPFNLAITAVILANALALGLETYPAAVDAYGGVLESINTLCFAIFLAELVLRIASYGARPWEFFRSGWNVFDFIVIGAALVPALRANASVIRLLRLLRILRLLRFLPDARLLLTTVIKAIPAVLSLFVLTMLVLFFYGMLGTYFFGADLPGSWGSIGSSMLTLFVLLTLENFPTYLDEAKAVSPLAVPFFLSYVLVASFVVFNLLIGIIIGAAESAREAERQRDADEARGDADPDDSALDRLRGIRAALDDLERDMEAARGVRRQRLDPTA